MLSSRLAVNVSTSLDVAGREHLVVVAKASWQIPQPGQRPRPIEPQAVAMADVFAGDPGASAMLYGTDLVRFKPRCDVLFNACAHAPADEPVTALVVAWQVGPLRKGMRVHGQRTWRQRFGVMSPGPAQPFMRVPLHYGMAFGGTRPRKQGRGAASVLSDAQLANPSGMGWFGSQAAEMAEGQKVPHLEALDDPVRKPDGRQMPIAFSAVARHWRPRTGYAGTYDDVWQRDVFPFLPDDFDEQFNQCAPADQQMPYPAGGEQVVLRNMMAARPDVRFALPRFDNVKISVQRSDFRSEEPSCPVDTLYFELEESRFSAVWRASVPIRRHVEEIRRLAIGPVTAQWWREQARDNASCDGCSPEQEAA